MDKPTLCLVPTRDDIPDPRDSAQKIPAEGIEVTDIPIVFYRLIRLDLVRVVRLPISA